MHNPGVIPGTVDVNRDPLATLNPYYSKDCQAFWCEHVGANPDHVVAALVARDFLGTRFWFVLQEYRGIRGGKVLLVFDGSPNVYQFEVLLGVAQRGFGGPYLAKFRAVDWYLYARCVGRLKQGDMHNNLIRGAFTKRRMIRIRAAKRR